MKPAFLTSEYPHPKTGASGGIGTSVRNLAQALAVGLEVSVLVYNQHADEVFYDGAITVYRIKNIRIRGFSWWFTRKKIEALINELHRNGKIDFVEAPDWTGITSFIKPKCPVIIRLNGSDSYFCHLENRPVKWINQFHEKRALKNADGLVSVSRFTADLTKRVFWLKRDFAIIPNCCPVPELLTGVTQHANTILYFGTLIRKKGLLELPGIFNEVNASNPEAKLVLVGRDSVDIATGTKSTWELMQPLFTDKARKNVSYVGAIPHSEINARIRTATVCIFPTFAEALPLSWLEAMGMEKAIVASNVGWAAEIIDDGIDGFLVDPKNHAEYAQKINLLLSDSQLCGTMGMKAREKVRSVFEPSVVAKRNIEFYKTILR